MVGRNFLRRRVTENLQYKKGNVFQIECILQHKRKKGVEFLVKWFGYPASFNS